MDQIWEKSVSSSDSLLLSQCGNGACYMKCNPHTRICSNVKQCLLNCYAEQHIEVQADMSASAAHVECVLTQLFIEVTLLLGHVCIQDQLLLAWQAILHVTLHTPQQERLQNGVQLCDHLQVQGTMNRFLIHGNNNMAAIRLFSMIAANHCLLAIKRSLRLLLLDQL